MSILKVAATTDEMDKINVFIEDELMKFGCSMKVQMQMALAVEEIFVNIASYAYHPEIGEAEISIDTVGDPPTVTVRFLDHGKPFNPLEKEDADTTLTAEERGVGGLGILLVKKNMDEVSYSYEGGKNILTIRKIVRS